MVRTKKPKKALERWVVKAGSQMVISGGPLLIRSWMQQVEKLLRLHRVEVVWVSSGAIATAVERLRGTGLRDLKRPKGGWSLEAKQALSAIGQPSVMELYELALKNVGSLGAQILLTTGDLKDPKRRRNFMNSCETLLRWGVTPILNENDAVATEEIRFGDNDQLSAQVAAAMNAARLVILTDVEGLFEKNPQQYPDAKLLEKLSGVTAKTLSLASGSRSEVGTGGMRSKLQAARVAGRAGVITHLVKGDVPEILVRLAQGESLGTKILPKSQALSRGRA
jgi:glutamate 5-kinase